jgi:hypothetical protein
MTATMIAKYIVSSLAAGPGATVLTTQPVRFFESIVMEHESCCLVASPCGTCAAKPD